MLSHPILAGDLTAGENAPEQIGQSPSGAGRGTYANIFPVLGTHVQETKDPPINIFVISCEQGCRLVKSIENCRKIQKLPNWFFWKLEFKLYNFY
jgi:hypothetical protein